MQRRSRVRRENVERRGFNPLLDRPLHRAVEYGDIVAVHPEDEAAVDHDARIVQAAYGHAVVPPQVLVLPLFEQVRGVECLEADEEASQAGVGRPLQQTGREHRVDRGGRLPQTPHAAHPVEQGCGEARRAEQVVVEEIHVPSGQAVDLGERGVDRLSVEGVSALEERLLVAEVADVRAAAGDDDRVGDQIELPFDEIATYRREIGEGPDLRAVDATRAAAPEVREKSRPRVFTRSKENRVGVFRRLAGSDVTCNPPSATCAPRLR